MLAHTPHSSWMRPRCCARLVVRLRRRGTRRAGTRRAARKSSTSAGSACAARSARMPRTCARSSASPHSRRPKPTTRSFSGSWPLPAQVEQRRHDLARHQVAGRAEDDEDGRVYRQADPAEETSESGMVRSLKRLRLSCWEYAHRQPSVHRWRRRQLTTVPHSRIMDCTRRRFRGAAPVRIIDIHTHAWPDASPRRPSRRS